MSLAGERCGYFLPFEEMPLKEIFGLEEFVTIQEILTVITKTEDCTEGDIRVGLIRPMRNGSNMTWIQCPLSTADKTAALPNHN